MFAAYYDDCPHEVALVEIDDIGYISREVY